MYWLVVDNWDFYEYIPQEKSVTLNFAIEKTSWWSLCRAIAVYDEYGNCHYAREL
jgi:hypothetical protein